MNIFNWLSSLFRKCREKSSGILFMAFASKYHKRNIVLPIGFNLDELITQYPPENYGFKSVLKFSSSKIYYFLGLLSSIPARNKDLINEEGWIPITISYVQRNIRDIISYKDYLITIGIIECDNIYSKGEKSYCYRWGEKYRDSPVAIQGVVCSHEENIYFKLEETGEVNIDKYPYLYHWYAEGNLIIDEKATQHALYLYNSKIQDRTKWDKNSNTLKLKHPHTQYQSAILNIDKIKNKQYESHIDTTVYRLHSAITNLQKDYRNFLSYNGEKLVSIDIANSQPYLACVLLNQHFWFAADKLPLTLYTLPESIQEAILRTTIPSELEKFFQECTDESFKGYKEVVASGNMYKTIAATCQNRLESPITIKEAKIMMFYLLFSSNQGQNKSIIVNQMKKIFSTDLFPKVAELFKIVKHKYKDIDDSKQHNRLACLLQSIESEIILHRCCKRIWEEGNQQVPVFTIHDSIATTIQHQEFVKNILYEELSKTIGIHPTFNIEYWKV